MQNINKKNLSLIGAIVLFADVLRQIITTIVINEYSFSFIGWALLLVQIVIGISLIIKKPIIAAVGSAALAVDYLVASISWIELLSSAYHFSSYLFVFIVTNIIYFVIFAFIAFLYLPIRKNINETILIIPAIVYLVINFVRPIIVDIAIGINISIGESFASLLGSLLLAFGIFVLAYVASYQNQNYVNSESTISNKPVPVKPSDPTSVLDKLTRLKSLLDNGVITQEEFDAKRTEILNRQ